ncbi:MAG: hypothetical protein ACYDC2_10080 [Solirubrobacteraceae bacterium]
MLGACGKTDLRRGEGPAPAGALGAGRLRAPSPAQAAGKQPPAIGERSVALPVALSAASAASFARAVQLSAADVTGGSPQPPSRTPRIDEEEAARCSGKPGRAVGGGRSPDYSRGSGLEREDVSSSVAVLSSEAIVRKDLEYTQSTAALGCFSRIVRNKLARESARVRLLGVNVTELTVELPGAQRAAGLRILARVGVPGSRVAVPLYSDVLTYAYGPAELNLYTTSFVQPAPVQTEQQLLTLMRERARLSRL